MISIRTIRWEISTFLVVFLLLQEKIQPARGQECIGNGTTCEECLAGFNCVWNVATNSCQEQCGDFPNVDCFYKRTFGTGSTIANMCEAAANKTEENKVCFSKETAQLCLQQAGCDWITGRIENGEERNWCALDVDYDPANVPCSSDTCDGCLADSNCVWMANDDKCSNSCDNFPNVDCYYPKMFGVDSTQNSVICDVANVSITENEACYNETSQDACFSVQGCGWIPTDQADPTNVGFCTIYLANYDGSGGGDDGGGSGSGATGNLLFHVSVFAFCQIVSLFFLAR